MTKGYHGSKTEVSVRDLWQTPQSIFDHYNERFNFNCDVAASWENRLCNLFIGEDSNALTVDWQTSNWCNPPYSDIKPWINKAIEQMWQGNLTVMLIPADTSTRWFSMAYENCNECHLISGRVSFVNSETGKPVSGNNKGSVVFVFDPHSPVSRHVCMVDRDLLM